MLTRYFHGTILGTRMHSNRMRTARVEGGGMFGILLMEGVHPGLHPSGCTLPPVNRMTHACKTLPYPILRLHAVIMM